MEVVVSTNVPRLNRSRETEKGVLLRSGNSIVGPAISIEAALALDVVGTEGS
jgi:hypothetical protein